MGTLNYIAKVDKPEYFDMGKHMYHMSSYVGLHKIFQISDLGNQKDVADMLLDCIHHGYWGKETDYTVYAHNVADIFMKWAGKDRLLLTSDNYILDIQYELKRLGIDCKVNQEYQETGSRYGVSTV